MIAAKESHCDECGKVLMTAAELEPEYRAQVIFRLTESQHYVHNRNDHEKPFISSIPSRWPTVSCCSLLRFIAHLRFDGYGAVLG